MTTGRLKSETCRCVSIGVRVLCLVIIAGNLRAQHDHFQVGYVPSEILSRAIPLREGIGAFHEAVSTLSPKAQLFYDQGQAYLHSYMWIEAAQSFHQALRFDSKLAMAYVGLSYAYSPIDFGAAQDALTSAMPMVRGISDRERRRVDIRRLQLEAMLHPQNATMLAAFREALDEALHGNPTDSELLLLRGNAEEPTPFGDGQGCVVSAIPYYQKVLELSPQNFAAHHYLAHCYENSGNNAEALKHAREYARLAPMVPHALHMLGHELRRNGEIEAAIKQFRRADRLEVVSAATENTPAFLNWHHAHNLGLLADCYQSLGQIKAAEATLRKEIELPVFTDYAMLARSNWTMFLLARKRFTEARDAAEQLQKLPSPLAQISGHALAGQADLFLNNSVRASRELRSAENAAKDLSSQDMAALRPYILALSIELQLTAHTPDQASVEHLIRRELANNNPDAWGQADFQLGLVAALAGQSDEWEIAKMVSQAMLAHDPAYAGSHFAVALVAEHDNDNEVADREFAAAAKLWNSSDPGFAELTCIQVRTRKQQRPASSKLQNRVSPGLQ